MKKEWLNKIKKKVGWGNGDEEIEMNEYPVGNISIARIEAVFIALADIIEILLFAKDVIRKEVKAKEDKKKILLDKPLQNLKAKVKERDEEIVWLKSVLKEKDDRISCLQASPTYRVNYMAYGFKEAKAEAERWYNEWRIARNLNEDYERTLKENGRLSNSEKEKEMINLQIKLMNLRDQQTFVRFKLKELAKYKEVLMHSYLETADMDSEWHKLKMKEIELCEKEFALLELEKKLKATDPNFLRIFTSSYLYSKKRKELLSLKKNVGKLNAYIQSEKIKQYREREEMLERKKNKLLEDTAFYHKQCKKLKELEKHLQREETELYNKSIEKQREIYEEIEKDERMLFVIRSLHKMSALYEVVLHILLAIVKNKKHRHIVASLLAGKSIYEIAGEEGLSPEEVRRISTKALKQQKAYSDSLG